MRFLSLHQRQYHHAGTRYFAPNRNHFLEPRYAHHISAPVVTLAQHRGRVRGRMHNSFPPCNSHPPPSCSTELGRSNVNSRRCAGDSQMSIQRCESHESISEGEAGPTKAGTALERRVREDPNPAARRSHTFDPASS
jgi:hypothetical protein